MKKFTLEEFEIITYVERNQGSRYSLEKFSNECAVDIARLTEVIEDLKDRGLIEDAEDACFNVTKKGYEKLEPYRVKKAVFMAAGFGSRMVPVTLNTPKPLIKVNGKRIIETLLDAIVGVGINDITIVRGYLGEQFELLLKKYPQIKFIDNPIYNESNNISSAYLVRNMLDNAYLLESDLLLYDKNVIRKYEYCSNCLGMEVDYTDDWCFETKDGIIKKFHIGGENVHHMFGISYWTQKDAIKLKDDFEHVFNSPGGKERYYDEVPFKECISHYKVRVRNVSPGSIIEIDTYNELKQIDPIYDV